MLWSTGPGQSGLFEVDNVEVFKSDFGTGNLEILGHSKASGVLRILEDSPLRRSGVEVVNLIDGRISSGEGVHLAGKCDAENNAEGRKGDVMAEGTGELVVVIDLPQAMSARVGSPIDTVVRRLIEGKKSEVWT